MINEKVFEHTVFATCISDMNKFIIAQNVIALNVETLSDGELPFDQITFRIRLWFKHR